MSSPLPEAIDLTVPDAPTGSLPTIGLGVASHGEPLNGTEISTLRKLRIFHLRVDLRLADKECAATFTRAARDAAQLNSQLELALHLPREGEADIREVVRAIEQAGVPLARILALREAESATSPATLAWVRKHFAALGAPIGAGSDCNFCELNREHALGQLALDDADFLFWSINPQVHAFDHRSLMETLEAQTATVIAARAFAGSRPLVISPVTLKQRFNPVVTGEALPPPPGELPAQVDPRQLSHFAAAWTLGSITALASAGVQSVTLYETTGWRGVLERSGGSPCPGKFPSIPGAGFPVFHALEHLAGFREGAAVPVPAAGLSALALFVGTRRSGLLVANHTEVVRTVRIMVPGSAARHVALGRYELRHVDLSGGDEK